MTTLLRINTSARINGSHSRNIADYFQSRWEKQFPQAKVLVRDLAIDTIPHISNEMIQFFHKSGGQLIPETALSNMLIQELKSMDHLLISSPLYNFTLPSSLKAYFDYVVRDGLTFQVKDEQYQGLLAGKQAAVISVRGGVSNGGSNEDFQTEYLQAILNFIGIEPVKTVILEGTALEEKERSRFFQQAQRQIDALFQTPEMPKWIGEITAEEKKEIGLVRAQQTQAIIDGDAASYANVCTEDVQLMIPGHDIIMGREKLQIAEEQLFQKASFVKFQKYPEKIERSGSIVVETGRQEVEMENCSERNGVYSTYQKYTHIYRLTSKGWRYAVLMSNPC